jgi:chromosome segregation protein
MTAEEAIAALKAKIDRLGPVNMMAIEQFDELETRHAFLTTQRQDLIDSIAQTAEAIKRIDETSKARFTEAFAAIQLNFQETFSTLFGGGRAGLTLLDENDPLESGIDIVASPPGKRLQSVQLLSGGEKALTAIALMFAIFRTSRAPSACSTRSTRRSTTPTSAGSSRCCAACWTARSSSSSPTIAGRWRSPTGCMASRWRSPGCRS